MFEKYEEGVIDLIEKLNIDRPVMTSYDIITQFNSINSKLKSEKSKNKEIKSEINSIINQQKSHINILKGKIFQNLNLII